MELMLEVISRHKFSLGKSASYIFGNVGGYIGRGKECEWVLPDKSQRISRKHALISFDGTYFFIEDLSTNGIYTVLGHERLPKGERYQLEHGASFLFGDYTVQARLLHRPDTYIPQDLESATELIPDKAFLKLDPLEAMEQQEEHEAKVRLGMYNDILGTSDAEMVFQQNHTESRLGAMPSVSAIPENWDLDEAGMPGAPKVSGAQEPAKAQPTARFAPVVDDPAQSPAAPSVSEVRAQRGEQTDMELFFRLLGFDRVPEDQAERELILRNAVELLMASVNGMIVALQNRAESKNELRLPITTMRLAGNNPLKFSPTAQVALEHLLGQKQNGMLSAGQAMLQGFEDLHGHNMGLLTGARAAVRAALEAVSPEKVAARLDVNGPVRLNRTQRLWHTYSRMQRSLMDDKDGFAAFFLKDFARAYELQLRTLHPLSTSSKEI